VVTKSEKPSATKLKQEHKLLGLKEFRREVIPHVFLWVACQRECWPDPNDDLEPLRAAVKTIVHHVFMGEKDGFVDDAVVKAVSCSSNLFVDIYSFDRQTNVSPILGVPHLPLLRSHC